MSEFLLEIYGEEIPSSAQLLAENQLRESFSNFLKKEKISFGLVEAFSTPRRITIIINGLKNQLLIQLRKFVAQVHLLMIGLLKDL